MNEHHELLRETLDRLFSDLLTREVAEAAETGEWPAALWKALEESGLTQPLLDDESSWEDARVVLEAAGRHAAPVPLAETVLAGWLLRRAGLEVPPGPLTVAGGSELRIAGDPASARLSGRAERVPWGSAAPFAVVQVGASVALVETGAAQVEPGSNLAREPRDTLRFDDAPVAAAAPLSPSAGAVPVAAGVQLYGALVRSLQLVGGLEHLLDESVRFAGERVQFGRPIGKFQAIQHMLAVLASETAAAGAAAQAACRAADGGDPFFEIAAAKVRCGEAAGSGARIAHQVHGAIGFTYEHALHFATRRLWSWRAEFGAESLWAGRLGDYVAARGADALWSDLTERASAAAR